MIGSRTVEQMMDSLGGADITLSQEEVEEVFDKVMNE